MNILAIDIGGTFIKYGVINENIEIVMKDEIPTPTENLDTFIKALDELVANIKINYKIDGITFSSPGSVEGETRIIKGASAIMFIHNNNWVNEFSERHQIGVAIENDANCAALAELYYGNAKDVNNIISLVFGTGLGGSVAVNKTIIHGKDLYGGEIGYMFADISNPHHTISQIISTAALVERTKYNNGLEVFQAYDDGEEQIINIVEKFYQDCAAVIFNLNHLLNPDLFLIGGAVSKRKDFVLKIKEHYQILASNHALDCASLNIKGNKFNNDSNLLGAYANYIKKISN